ncbi:hypothetical protein BDY24DRAFT_412346 [Mrakia frigida]|uniref:uncharacterized protein n=1 Tax=Mrakia frigida TaxID=29902 RepID=UPI003FCC01DB
MSDLLENPPVLTISIPLPGKTKTVRAVLYAVIAASSFSLLIISATANLYYHDGDMIRYGMALGVMTLVASAYNGFFVAAIRPEYIVTQIRFELAILAVLAVQWLITACLVTVEHSVSSAYGAFIWIGWIALQFQLAFLVGIAFFEHRRGRTEVWTSNMHEHSYGRAPIQLPVHDGERVASPPQGQHEEARIGTPAGEILSKF